MSQCTRPTKSGKDCGRHSVSWHGITAVADPKACHNHLTADERAALKAHREAAEAARQAALAMDPSCWSWPWPVPDGPDWERLLAWHHDRCAICGAAASLVEDHDHRTGMVRGWLCTSCNTQEGHYGSAAVFVKYRQRPPAAILGIFLQYVHPITGKPARPMLESRSSLWDDPVTDGIGL